MGILRMSSKNLKRQTGKVGFEQRERCYQQTPLIFWFTGLSGAGKTTIAVEFEKRLFEQGYLVYHLDADDLRKSLNADLGFSMAEREENIRRAAVVARILQDAGLIVLATFISPTAESRQIARDAARENLFVEVYVRASLAVCMQRDPKGFYRRAVKGEIQDYTGIDSLYVEPQQPDLMLDTEALALDACVQRLMDLAASRGVLRKGSST